MSGITNSSTVSALLARSNEPKDLLIDDRVSIDNTVPSVLRIISNGTAADGSIVSHGSQVLISVEFSKPVTVRGVIRLHLKGKDASCPALYYSGNNTNSLHFIYGVSSSSGVSRLDCTSVDSLDVANGKVYRLAYPSPSISANVSATVVINLSATTYSCYLLPIVLPKPIFIFILIQPHQLLLQICR